MVEQLPEALITRNEIRCPICGKKHGELTGNEVIKGFKMFCRGKDQYAPKHFFIINFDGRDENADTVFIRRFGDR